MLYFSGLGIIIILLKIEELRFLEELYLLDNFNLDLINVFIVLLNLFNLKILVLVDNEIIFIFVEVSLFK